MLPDELHARVVRVCAVSRGEQFGAPGYLRFAYCVPMETIDEGIAAMISELAALLDAAASAS